ncbi:MAG: hypothetical protein ACI8SE_000926 [Bacteroidia bacterium]|jgi:hypothetical protein
MKKLSYIAFYILSAVLVFSCQKDQIYPVDITPTNNSTSPYDTTKYNSHEIFPDSLLELYGHWHLTKITGGLSGNGYPVDSASFDALEIKPYGIYIYFKDSVLVGQGRIKLDSNTSRYGVLAYFIGDSSSNPNGYLYRNLVSLNDDELYITSFDLTDAFGYEFKRKKN